MGAGDVRTRRGKIANGSYGKTRPRNEKAKQDAKTPARPKGR
jgi:ribosomal small subunit protein bTHX